MLTSVRTFVCERKRGLYKTAGVVGTVYVVGRYISERLEDVRGKMVEEKKARDILRRRFQKTREDVSLTVMALMPTLADQILQELDVEGVTQELQSKSRSAKAVPEPPVQPPQEEPTSQSSLTSSMELVPDQDSRSDAGSMSTYSFTGDGDGSSSHMAESSRSWVDQFTPGTASLELPAPNLGSPPSIIFGPNLSDSITTSSSISFSAAGENQSEATTSSSSELSSRSKAELWKEVKMLTFTRTLTIVYSATLLSLFTSIQLTVLGRAKYVHSILQEERDEQIMDNLRFSPSSLFIGEGDGANFSVEENRTLDSYAISDEEEAKYLTLSWWILHVGWKDLSERVRRGVEEVFDGVSLKTKLGAIDLHRLLGDVRRRVEHEVTFEGRERRVNFLSSLIPPTTEMMHHLLIQGGISPFHATQHSPLFTSLLDETRSILSSKDFAHVLEVALDKSTEVLFDGLEKNVFVESGSRVDEAGMELKLRLAGLLPGLARWSHTALNGLPNELIDGLMNLREVAGLSAIVFSKFEDEFR